MTKKKNIIFLTVLLTALYVVSCENDFQPMVDNDQYVFSIYGALNVHADTQWVRVMPITNTLIPIDSSTNVVEVTITEKSTGKKRVLNDSLFVFGNEAHVWNYWTVMPIKPNESYTIQAEAEDGRTSRVSTTVPSFLPPPLVSYFERGNRALITGSTKEPLVEIDVKIYVQEVTSFGHIGPEISFRHTLLPDLVTDSEGNYRISVNLNEVIYEETYYEKFKVNKRELFIATGSKEWLDVKELSTDAIALPGVASNVENGTGMVVGVARREVPLKNCYGSDNKLIPCEEL